MGRRRRASKPSRDSRAVGQIEKPEDWKRRTALTAAVLGVVTVGLYASVATFGFVHFDDPTYVTENQHVLRGLSLDGIRWAFTTGHGSNWHPLTWLSHMLDVELFGPAPGPQHLMNALLHAANTVLLFLWLGRATGFVGRSAFVAALFAVHPLHVESVAWISERKDVLSTFFWLLTTIAYTTYARAPSRARYVAVLVFFTLGLLSKPMVVTLPFVLLLLDVWPLRRIELPPFRAIKPAERAPGRGLFPLVAEKAPLMVLALLSSVVTFVVQQRGGAVGSLVVYPLGARLSNAVVSYLAYIGKIIWPSDLSVFYPYGESIGGGTTVAAVAALAVVTLLAVRNVARYPYLFVGWLWYVGTLVPVIGIVQVGLHSRADRYTYVPSIGLFIIAAWGFADLAKRLPRPRIVLATAATSAVLAYGLVARRQLRTWRDSVSLWQHAIDVTSENGFAHYNLGVVLTKQGRVDDGIARFREALRIDPNNADAHIDLGNALKSRGDIDGAITEFATVVRLRPDYADARTVYGNLLLARGRNRDAIDQYRQAIRLDPASAAPHNELGNALASEGLLTEALAEYAEAAHLDPTFAEAHNNLGTVYARQGKPDLAIREFLEALRLKPNDVMFHYNAALMLEQQQHIPEALQHLDAALRIDPAYEPARRAADRLKPPGGPQ